MADIYIRDIDDATKARLCAEARKHGMSLNKFVIAILNDYASSPAVRSIEDRYTNLAKDMISLYEQTLRKTNELLSETNYLLNAFSKEAAEDQSWLE